MAVVQIRKAQREGARLVIGIAGVSGSGKTFTALQLAYGLTNGDGNKVGFLDTENRRGSLYADEDTYRKVQQSLGMQGLPEPFLVGDLYAPFSPERYIAAIQDFQAAGVEVLVIDSATHEYEGTGGCIEIAEAGNPKIPNWNKAKAVHKRFMNAVLQCDMHIIFCVRAREKAKPERGANGKIEFSDLGLQPIQEKNFMFEMTASVMIHDQGHRQQVLKCPAMLQDVLGRGEGYITAADGKRVRAWVDGAKQLDPQVERYRNALQSVTEQGMDALRDAWGKTPQQIRASLGEDFLATLKESARAFDEVRAVEDGGSSSPAAAAVSAAISGAARGNKGSAAPAKTSTQPDVQAPAESPAPVQAQAPATAAATTDDDVF